MKHVYEVIKGAVLTEKANLMQETSGVTVFKVDPRANKVEIRRAVEELFHVKVAEVRTVAMRGKRKRVGLKSVGRTKDWKKAYVTLSEGEINLLDEL